ncbi:MAG: hypothetical protein H6R36_89 [Chloroflexi bacterium]|nr:hypothetical protein [Chloroflexota bacterium]
MGEKASSSNPKTDQLIHEHEALAQQFEEQARSLASSKQNDQEVQALQAKARQERQEAENLRRLKAAE